MRRLVGWSDEGNVCAIKYLRKQDWESKEQRGFFIDHVSCVNCCQCTGRHWPEAEGCGVEGPSMSERDKL